MTEDITTNKGNNSVYEYSNSFDVSVNNNIDSNVLLYNKLNGEISGQSESSTCSGVNDKKSFHITSVTVQHNSTDGNADESADESRTEELSDNIDMSAVDVQTDVPDLTENLIRKDDVLYRVTSVGSAPIIPTSAQYGIAVVSNCNTELSDNPKFVPNDSKLSDLTKRTEFMSNGLEINSNIVTKDLNTQIKNERFKVVKIESNEPFKRGRWVCMDFSDQSMDQLKKSAISISDNEKCLKKDTPDKETSPSELLINGIVMDNVSTTKDASSNVETDKGLQNAQVNESNNYHNGDISGMNSVSPNQTFNASFVPPSNVNQQQAQSLTHIIIPQGTSTQVASGSYGHSQSLPHSELQHVHQTTAQQQQQQQQQPPQQQVHVVSSLQQSFHPHTSLQHQGLLSQGTCPVSNMQHLPTQQQQSDTVYNQSTQSTMSIQQSQQQPLLQQQYQTIPQGALNPSPQQCNNQRGPSNTQQQPQPQLPPSNPHCISQMSSQPSQQTVQTNGNESIVNGQQSMPQTNQQVPVQTQFQQNQAQGQQLQHSMQQVPIQQQTFQHPVTQQSSQQPLMHQMASQHHSPQQQTNQSVQSMPTQQITQTSSNQTSSQPSLPANIQQPVLQQGMSHSLPQQQTVPPAAVQSSVQFLPQQQSVIQSTQQPAQQVMNQSVQPQQIIQQQMQGSTDPQIHIPVQQIQQNSQALHQTQSLSQSTQQQQQQQQQPSQQIMPQQMPSQMQQSQPQISHQQQMQHIPQQQIQQTQVQHPNQQPISQSSQPTQQLTMQQQPLQQQIPHHQQIIQSVPQQQQQTQQPQQQQQSQQQQPQQQQQQPPPQQMMQTQIQQSQNISQSSVQSNSFQNSPQQTMSQPSQQSQQQPVQNQVMQQCVQSQQIPPIQQSLPQPSHSIQSSQQLQQPVQSTQSIQHSFPQQVHAPVQTQQMPPQSINGGQTIQQPYQSSVTHQNVPSQINDQNIPVSSTQTYQHDVVLSNVNQPDVMVQNQYPLGQNISIQTQLPLHVSLNQPYQNTGSSNYVNASNMNLMTNTSMASQQTPPISQQQYFNHSVSQSIPHSVQSTGSVTSQDLQQLAHHQGISTMTQSQSGTVNPNVSSLGTPLISTVSSQNLPMTDYLPQQTSNAQSTQIIGQQHSQNVNNSCQIPYSVHSQNIYQQSGIVSQTSSSVQTQTTPISQLCSTSGILQQYAVPQSVPSVLSSVQVPGSSSYLPNIGSVHSNQLQQQNYIHNVSMPGSQIYSSGHNPSNVSFADVVASSEQHNLQHVHFPEQVSDNVKISEDVNFHRQEDAEKKSSHETFNV